jgi:HAL2 family 3'(2'),5'-bisphosphate nucleotidase
LPAPESPELATALDAVRLAARVCRNVQGSISDDVLEKQDRSPVTVADFASQAVVCRALQAAFPAIPIVAEEDAAELRQPENAPLLERIQRELAAVGVDGSPDDICRWIDHGNGKADSPRYWTLDPIDGTKGFLRGEQYAVALALLVDHRLEVAVVGCPNLPAESSSGTIERAPGGGVLQFAVRGQGAWQRPAEGDADAVSIHVSPASAPAEARLCESVEKKHTAHSASARIAAELGITRDPVRIDSQAKYAVVARGDADFYLRLPTRSRQVADAASLGSEAGSDRYVEKIWDHAGGALLVQEAGGRVTDVDGKPLDWTHGDALHANRGLIVTNGRLHEAVLAAVRRSFAS